MALTCEELANQVGHMDQAREIGIVRRIENGSTKPYSPLPLLHVTRHHFAMQDQIAKTVGARFISPNGKVLLGLRAPSKKVWPLYWDTIGGRVEDGESPDDALLREVQEEVGVTPTQFRSIATVKERQPEIYGDALHHIYAVTRWQGGDPVNVCDEHTELKWFSISRNASADEHCRFRLSPVCPVGYAGRGSNLGSCKRGRSFSCSGFVQDLFPIMMIRQGETWPAVCLFAPSSKLIFLLCLNYMAI
jgi:8-oxo-dGTP pyrophosphatase MutT (NUDIX family)